MPCLFSFSSMKISQLDFLYKLNSLLFSALETELNDNEDCKSRSIIFNDFIKSISYWIDYAFTLLKHDFSLFLSANLFPTKYSLSRYTESELTLELLSFIMSNYNKSAELYNSRPFFGEILDLLFSILSIFLGFLNIYKF